MFLKRKMVLFLAMIVVIISFVFINLSINNKRRNSVLPIKDNYHFAYDVENVLISEEYLDLSGWFFELKSVHNQAVENTNNKVTMILVDKNNKEVVNSRINGFAAEMSYNKRSEVNEYFKCNYDYTDCGFVARFNKKDISPESEYQIFFKMNVDDYTAIETGLHLKNGKIYKANADNCLNVDGTDLEPVVKNGTLLADRDEGIYVYQYKGQLYWIATEKYFNCGFNTVMQYQIETTQFENLPKDRTERNQYWSNLGSEFEKYEITSVLNCGAYRVYARTLPTEYSITFIETGTFNNDRWEWREVFRPDYSELFGNKS